MNQNKEFFIELNKVVKKENIEENAYMNNYTSFRVGGPVDIMIQPDNYKEIKEAIKLCNKYNIKYFIMGNGSNLLVKDGGIEGVVIKLSKLNNIKVDNTRITAQSGAELWSVSDSALKASLTGLEFACGIPGSVGGAVAMNAGAYNGEVVQVIESALLIDKEGNERLVNKEELALGYRASVILDRGYTVLEATFNLVHGDYEKIKGRIDDLTRRRKEKQPLEFASAGSTFKRPEGYFAAKLIEDCGLKGLHVGDAEVSMKHSGFIINKGSATARDILDLIEKVQKRVKENFGVDLHTEVRILGRD